MQVLFPGNDQTLRLNGVRDETTGTFINDAVVTVHVQKESGADVVGQVWPLTLAYIPGSDGNYWGNLDAGIVLENGTIYVVEIRAVAPDGRVGLWRKEWPAKHRTF